MGYVPRDEIPLLGLYDMKVPWFTDSALLNCCTVSSERASLGLEFRTSLLLLKFCLSLSL